MTLTSEMRKVSDKVIFYFVKSKKTSERFRGRIFYDSKKCIGCQACFRNCPSHAITFFKKGRIDFDMGKCIHCGLCRDVCPVKCIHYTKQFRYSSEKRRDLKNLVK